MITTFDRQNTTLLTAALEKAMTEVAKDFGVSVRSAGWSVRGKAGTLKFEVGVIEKDGKAATVASQNLDAYGAILGVKMGHRFVTNTGMYEVTGYKPRNHKYPVIAKDVKTGKSYKFPMSAVK